MPQRNGKHLVMANYLPDLFWKAAFWAGIALLDV
jgi:hypothetical protein